MLQVNGSQGSTIVGYLCLPNLFSVLSDKMCTMKVCFLGTAFVIVGVGNVSFITESVWCTECPSMRYQPALHTVTCL